jgi:hypothetical protein
MTYNYRAEIPNIRKQIAHVSEAAMAASGEGNRVVAIAVDDVYILWFILSYNFSMPI